MDGTARLILCIRVCLLGIVVVAACTSPILAQNINVGDLQIDHPWSRATPPGAQVAAGYLGITNKGTSPDRLLGGSSPAAGKVEVHEMAMKDDVMNATGPWWTAGRARKKRYACSGWLSPHV